MKNTFKKFLCVALSLVMLCVPVVVSAEDNYIHNDGYISEGVAEYALSTDYEYTLFTLEPTIEGEYTISVDRGVIGICSYTGMWVTIEPSADTIKDTSFVWSCTSVGQSIWVAVKADSDTVTISVERKDAVVETIEKVTYVNTVTPKRFKFIGNAAYITNVNYMNSAIDQAVLCDDGYYRLNSEEGNILYVNLSDTKMSLFGAADLGRLTGAEYNEDGKAVKVINYSEALIEYYNCADSATGLYPLTEDLMIILKESGKNLGWYDGTWIAGATKDDAWMFACYYTTMEINVGDIDNNKKINSADSLLAKRIAAGIDTPTEAMSYAADVNCDTRVNAADTNIISRYIGGVIFEFPVFNDEQ